MISYILPTRNRPARLAGTLASLGQLSVDEHESVGGAEVIVVDNASDPPADLPATLANGFAVRGIRLNDNRGAAARNRAAERATGEWLVMLDDDSHPVGSSHLEALRSADEEIAAIGAEILLPDGRHEDGGLPEVFIGCGVAIRAVCFRDAGGYDAAFGYYAEEYDLAARLILAGWRIVHDARFRVMHEKSGADRDMNLILQRLARNNGWVAQRYAPDAQRRGALHEVIQRYAQVSVKEAAASGYAAGVAELLATLESQPRRAMSQAEFDRFTGLAAAREWLRAQPDLDRSPRVAIVAPGKNAWGGRQALRERGVELVGEDQSPDVLVIGTLSPGPMLDAWLARRDCDVPVLLSAAPPRHWQPAHG